MNKKLSVTFADCKYPDTKIYIEENLKEKTYCGTGNLFCFWIILANTCSIFSCISYFVLESRQVKYLDIYD